MFSLKRQVLVGFFVTLAAIPSSVSQSPSSWECWEKTDLHCYSPNAKGDDIDKIDLDEVAYNANIWRGWSEEGPAFYTMPARKNRSEPCQEWMVPEQIGSTLVLAKHMDMGINSSVSFADIATTIDGGADATEVQKLNKSLLGCPYGGQFAVQVNASDPVYGSEEYKATGGVPRFILIKVVKPKAKA